MTGITPFQGYTRCLFVTQGRRASRLPLAIILRAVGALIRISRCWRSGPTSYCAPLALWSDFLCKANTNPRFATSLKKRYDSQQKNFFFPPSHLLFFFLIYFLLFVCF